MKRVACEVSKEPLNAVIVSMTTRSRSEDRINN